MSLLSVTAQFFWQVSLGSVVKAELFMPPPKVDSQILIMHRRSTPLFPDVQPKDFFKLVKIGYAQRRKTLLNNLTNGLSLSREETQELCSRVAIDPSRRAQTLRLQEWHNLYLLTR
jgi:16S rRNA (adenine1518-N6/adenine1519-N6)-dimethyltransferase